MYYHPSSTQLAVPSLSHSKSIQEEWEEEMRKLEEQGLKELAEQEGSEDHDETIQRVEEVHCFSSM